MQPRQRHPSGYQERFKGSNYTPAEVEFIRAVDEYRRRTGRKFLTATEYLAIAVQLGYRRPKGK